MTFSIKSFYKIVCWDQECAGAFIGGQEEVCA